MKKNIVVSIVVVTVISIGISIWGLQERENSFEKLTIAISPQPVYALMFVALSNGYFEDEELDVTFRYYTVGRDALSSVLMGDADLATTYHTPIVHRTFEGEKLSVLTTLHQSEKTTALVGLKSHGIDSVNDLVGKTIAVPKNTNAEIQLFALLVQNKIQLSDVTIIDILPQDVAQILKNETVDAVMIWNPHLYNLKHSFSQENITIIYPGITNFSVLVGKSDFVTENNQTMIKLVKSIIKAEDFIQNNNDDALRITSESLSVKGIDGTEYVWNDIKFVAKLDSLLLSTFEQEAQLFYEQGKYSDPIPDFNSVIVPDYLEIVSPNSVSIMNKNSLN